MNLKKLLITGTLILGLGALAVGCSKGGTESPVSKSAESNTVQELRVAIQPAASYAPLFVVKEKGWLEEALKAKGVSVKWTSFKAGPPENESFAAGQQDIGVMGDVPAIIARSAGQDTRIIGIASYGPKAFAVVIPTDSPIKSPKELKGKKVALVKGSYAHHLLVLVLEANGLTVDDIKVINLQVGDMQNALANKEVDAAVMWEPNITKSEEAGVSKVLVDGTGLKRGELTIMGRNEFLTNNPEIAKIFLENYQKGSEFIKDNPDEAAGLVAKDFNLQPSQLEKVFPKYYYTTTIDPVDIQELKKSADFMYQAKLIKQPVDISAFVDQKYQAGLKR